MSPRILKYAIDQRYGVVARKRKNVILVGDVGHNYIPFENLKELDEHIKKQKLPVADGPIYEAITDHEQLKQYCRDQKIDKELDLRKSMDNLRKDVKEYYEKADSRLDADNADGLLAKS